MRIIISPAKKMNVDTDTYRVTGLPMFLEDTKQLMQEIRGLSYSEAKALWKCNEKLAELNYQRFQDMDLEDGPYAAVLTYEGLQYQHMAPEIFTEEALSYIEEHSRILSGFYGILKPFERSNALSSGNAGKTFCKWKKDLYDFWGERLYLELISSDRQIINLASKEYSKAIEKYLTPKDSFITVEFCEVREGKAQAEGDSC